MPNTEETCKIHRPVDLVGEGYKRKARQSGAVCMVCVCVWQGDPEKGHNRCPLKELYSSDQHGEQMSLNCKGCPQLVSHSFIAFTSWLHLSPVFGTPHELLNA
jgi:hypothetical protein